MQLDQILLPGLPGCTSLMSPKLCGTSFEHSIALQVLSCFHCEVPGAELMFAKDRHRLCHHTVALYNELDLPFVL